jgi:hypothetical protein
LAGETTGITAGALAAKLLRAAWLLSGGVRLLVRSVAAKQKMGVVNILLTTLFVAIHKGVEKPPWTYAALATGLIEVIVDCCLKESNK